MALDDFVVTNASVSDLAGGGERYAVLVSPDGAGEVTLRLPADVANDDAGRGNLASNLLPVTVRREMMPPVIGSFTATLRWQIDDGGAPLTELRVTPGPGSVLGQSEVPVAPAFTTTYVLSAGHEEGVALAETTVHVERPLPSEDALSNLAAPGRVVQGETVTVSVDYAAVDDRELRVWLQDSNANWRTAAQGVLMVGPGAGRHTFELAVDGASRVGDGYVWAVRLLPPGWGNAEDAVAEVFGLAAMQEGDLLPPQEDVLGWIDFPELAESPSTLSLEVPYQATERRELRVFLHDSESQWFICCRGRGHGRCRKRRPDLQSVHSSGGPGGKRLRLGRALAAVRMGLGRRCSRCRLWQCKPGAERRGGGELRSPHFGGGARDGAPRSGG